MPWLSFGFGVETHDRGRTQELLAAYFGRVDDLAYDEALRDRYRRSGIDSVFLSWSILDPGDKPRRVYRRRTSPREWGEDGDSGLYVEASFPDRPELSKDDLDEYLGHEARKVMEGWRRLAG